MRFIFAGVLAFAVSAGLPATGYGATIEGILNITGVARVTATEIDFLPLGGGEGNFNIPMDDPGTGSFTSALNVGEVDGAIKDLALAVNPVGESFLLNDFMTFLAAGYEDLSFNLTFIAEGVSGSGDCDAAVEPGQICTPEINGIVSPFNLQNLTMSSSTASFSVAGNVTDGSGDVSSFTGTFTAPFETLNYQQVLAQFAQSGYVQAPYSAQFTVVPGDTPVIPEPGTIFLFGAGVLGIGLIRRGPKRA